MAAQNPNSNYNKEECGLLQKLQGVGVGLRTCHYSFINKHHPKVAWFEVLADNYLGAGGIRLAQLEKIRSTYPITLHCVGMSIGSTDPLNFVYLKQLKTLISQVTPLLVSDHLAWTAINGQYFHDLLPLPYTEEALLHTARRIQAIQDFLGQQIMLENVSSYLNFKHSTLSEWEFLQAVAEEADCLILLDINNIYVSAYNNNFLATDYLANLNTQRIAQFHLAGFQDQTTHLLDTHGSSVHPEVLDLFATAVKKWGPLPTIIEWDNHIPEFPLLLQEVQRAQCMMTENYAYTC